MFLESSNILLEEWGSILGRLSPLRDSSVKYQVSQIEKKCLRKDSCKNLEYFLRAGELGRQFSQDAMQIEVLMHQGFMFSQCLPIIRTRKPAVQM